MLYKLSFGRTGLIGASESALKSSLERFVVIEDYLSVFLLKYFRVSKVVSYSGFELRECVAFKVSGDIYNLIGIVKEAGGVVL